MNHRRFAMVGAQCIAAGVVLIAAGCAPELKPTAPASEQRRFADYVAAKSKARGWLDRLEVDAVELTQNRVKGVKKVAEILDAYSGLFDHATNEADRASIRARMEAIAEQTRRPEYHDLGTCPDAQFRENSMSYLRVLLLLERAGLDTRRYRRELAAIKPRLDAHLSTRGPWQRAMFAEYYDRFGLEKPDILAEAPMQAGVIGRRVPVTRIDSSAAYGLTHEIFVVFDYGHARTQTVFSPADLAYVREVLPALIRTYMNLDNHDLVGELLICMTYLGWHDDAVHSAAVDFLLDRQNQNGSWGDYEAYRPRFGRYLEQHVYLHTTLVVLDALMEAFEGGWQRE